MATASSWHVAESDEDVRRGDAELASAFSAMPMWAHSITNVGNGELVTMFWADQLLDQADADQFPERVSPEVAP